MGFAFCEKPKCFSVGFGKATKYLAGWIMKGYLIKRIEKPVPCYLYTEYMSKRKLHDYNFRYFQIIHILLLKVKNMIFSISVSNKLKVKENCIHISHFLSSLSVQQQ